MAPPHDGRVCQGRIAVATVSVPVVLKRALIPPTTTVTPNAVFHMTAALCKKSSG